MRVVLAGESGRAVQHLRPQVNGLGLECEATDCVSFDNVRLRMTAGAAVDLVLVVTGEDHAAALDAVRQLAPNFAVLATAGPDEAFMDQLLRAGARGLVDLENFRPRLQDLLEQLVLQRAIQVRRGRLIAVTSAQGGSGVTTAASALAFALAAQHPNDVILAELAAVPELALDLDLQVKYSLGDLLDGWQRSDLHMVRQVATQHPGGVQVLAFPAETLEGRALAQQQMRQLLVLLREAAGFAVLDLGHSLTPGTREAFRLADSIVLLLRPDVPGVRLARAYLGRLRDEGVPLERIRPLANRSGYRRQVAQAELEKALGMAPAEWVPDDPTTMNAALAEGQPLAQYAPRARITRAFERLARSLAVAAS
jgi:pilus assembly protein CpaE